MNKAICGKRLALLVATSEVPDERALPNKKVKDAGLPELLTTVNAAKFLNRAPQTLRKWACLGIGPVQPIKIFGRLAWKATDLLALVGENHGD